MYSYTVWQKHTDEIINKISSETKQKARKQLEDSWVSVMLPRASKLLIAGHATFTVGASQI
jgi:hypothetical protein